MLAVLAAAVLDRSPGESSGGSATALATGLAPLATTSDEGGSVRIPASCCGSVCYEPTVATIGLDRLPAWIGSPPRAPPGTAWPFPAE